MLPAVFDHDHLIESLGLPRATQLSKVIFNTVLLTRNAIHHHRRRLLRTEPHFISGQAGSSPYPDCYRLNDIGPGNIMTPANQPHHEPS